VVKKRKKGSPLCTIDVGKEDRKVGLLPDSIRSICWNCNLCYWEPKQSIGKARCICGVRLLEVVQLNRFTYGAFKQAVLRKD
jgi:hypothetical protein